MPPRTKLLLFSGVMLVVASAAITFALYRFSSRLVDNSPLERVPSNAPYIQSPDRIVAKMVEVANLKETDLVYDLGCGDGRFVIAAALQGGCRGVGFDIDPQRVAEATENVNQAGLQKLVTIKEQDIFAVELSEADVVMLYLLPWMVKKLIPQFQRMKPGARIVIHDDRIPGYKPDESYTVPEKSGVGERYVNVWIAPLTKSPD